MFIMSFYQDLTASAETLRHKVAVIRLQRLSAPVASLALVGLTILLLTVCLTSSSSVVVSATEVELVEAVETPLLEDPPPPPEEIPPEVQDVHVEFDVPVAPVEQPAAAQQSTPTPTNTVVSMTPSPLVIKGVAARSGGGVGLGSSTRFAGDLTGALYDFKRTSNGQPRKVDYWQDLKALITIKEFKGKGTVPFYTVEKRVYLSHLLVDQTSAEAAPDVFGVKGLMGAKQWVARYQGRIQPETSGTYQFVGHFDDAMIILVNGVVVFDSGWDYIGKQSPVTGWAPKEHIGAYPVFSGQSLVYSTPIPLKADQSLPLTIYIGERPGGKIGGILLVKKLGERYAKAANGQEILPIFATSHLSYTEKERLRTFKKHTFDMKIPLMNTRGVPKPTFTEATDIQVDCGDL